VRFPLDGICMTPVIPSILRPLALALVVSLLGACNPIYKLDIQQGNLFSKTQVESLKPGMTKRQVILTMGSPSVVNPFQQARWDYISTERRGNGRMETKDLTLLFDGDNLTKIDGDYFAENPSELILEATKYKRQYPDEKRTEEEKKKKDSGDQGGA
jgi:outer membrane protein assembly factor BamE